MAHTQFLYASCKKKWKHLSFWREGNPNWTPNGSVEKLQNRGPQCAYQISYGCEEQGDLYGCILEADIQKWLIKTTMRSSSIVYTCKPTYMMKKMNIYLVVWKCLMVLEREQKVRHMNFSSDFVFLILSYISRSKPMQEAESKYMY